MMRNPAIGCFIYFAGICTTGSVKPSTGSDTCTKYIHYTCSDTILLVQTIINDKITKILSDLMVQLLKCSPTKWFNY